MLHAIDRKSIQFVRDELQALSALVPEVLAIIPSLDHLLSPTAEINFSVNELEAYINDKVRLRLLELYNTEYMRLYQQEAYEALFSMLIVLARAWALNDRESPEGQHIESNVDAKILCPISLEVIPNDLTGQVFLVSGHVFMKNSLLRFWQGCEGDTDVPTENRLEPQAHPVLQSTVSQREMNFIQSDLILKEIETVRTARKIKYNLQRNPITLPISERALNWISLGVASLGVAADILFLVFPPAQIGMDFLLITSMLLIPMATAALVGITRYIIKEKSLMNAEKAKRQEWDDETEHCLADQQVVANSNQLAQTALEKISILRSVSVDQAAIEQQVAEEKVLAIVPSMEQVSNEFRRPSESGLGFFEKLKRSNKVKTMEPIIPAEGCHDPLSGSQASFISPCDVR